jgi:hypothetical protein
MDCTTDNETKTLEIIPANQLRLIPLYIIIIHIYEKIIEKASDCEVSYAFNIDQLFKNYEINTKIATPDNKMYIINEIKRLFPGIKITEIAEKYNAKSLYNSHWSVCWDDDDDDEVEILETCDGEYDDIILNRAIQESLKEVKKNEIANNSIMGEKAEERLQKSRQKYKKLYK